MSSDLRLSYVLGLIDGYGQGTGQVARTPRQGWGVEDDSFHGLLNTRTIQADPDAEVVDKYVK